MSQDPSQIITGQRMGQRWFGFLVYLTQSGDLLVKNALSTWFGGDSDPQDDGETACGYSTKDHPDLLGCALPMTNYGVMQTQGSPLPRMPYGLHADGSDNPDGAHVRVYNPDTDIEILVPVIDLGPAYKIDPDGRGHAIDLTVAAFQALGGNLEAGTLTVHFRVMGGAKWLT